MRSCNGEDLAAELWWHIASAVNVLADGLQNLAPSGATGFRADTEAHARDHHEST
jgi:hypothetical protein